MDLYIVAMTTRGTARLACNWLKSVARTGQDDRVRMFCLDPASAEICSAFVVREDIAAEVMPLRSPREVVDDLDVSKSLDYGTLEFAEVMLAKLQLLIWLSPTPDLGMHFTPFLYTDVDTVFCDDPCEYLQGLGEGYDVWAQSDRLDEIPRPDPLHWQYCMGCVYCRHPTQELWQLSRQYLIDRLRFSTSQLDSFVSDQAAVNLQLAKSGLRLGVLSPQLWINGGRTWPVLDDARKSEPGVYPPILLHANYIIGAELKERRLRDHGCWFVSDESLKAVGL